MWGFVLFRRKRDGKQTLIYWSSCDFLSSFVLTKTCVWLAQIMSETTDTRRSNCSLCVITDVAFKLRLVTSAVKRETQSIIVELEARKECMVRAVCDWPQKTAPSLLAEIMMVYKKIAPSLWTQWRLAKENTLSLPVQTMSAEVNSLPASREKDGSYRDADSLTEGAEKRMAYQMKPL